MQHTVLFVDDDANLTQGFSRSLHREPYRVLTANSGEEALALLAAEAVDVVVSDEHMPGLSGTELLTEIARAQPGIVRVILSGGATVGMALRAVNEGTIFRLLLKPVVTEELAATIRRCLIHKVLLDHARATIGVMARQRRLLAAVEQRHPGLLLELGTGLAQTPDVAVAEAAGEEELDGHLEVEIRRCGNPQSGA